jgi:hypothetical protein
MNSPEKLFDPKNYTRRLIWYVIILLFLAIIIVVVTAFFLPYKGGDDFSKMIITITPTVVR